ncbi:hypothetical protein KC351_g16440 [Hortaea werneckii]|nr:hypothetical protein KC351_g16440 [Hortaea werneckii]
MATSPIITFKAGKCTPTPSAPGKSSIKPDPTPGYLYLYSEDDLLHFCWRPRSAPSTDPELDLLMIPGDGSFQPLVKNPGAETVESPTTGRIFVLRFQSSSQKHFFWMQSKTQASGGKLNEFGERDQRLGQIVDLLLQGEDVNVQEEIEEIRRGGGGDDGGPNGDADAMEVDDQGHGLSRQGSGGAGADATGGDARDEGEASREGGADGGRAPQDPSALVQNFLNSLNNSGPNQSSQQQQQQQQQQADKPFTTLPDLLTPSTTIPYIDTAPASQINTLCTFLPPELFLLAQEHTSDPSSTDPHPTPAAAEAAIEALSLPQKKEILKRALRSPQFQQSLGSLTVALRDGGLPMIGDALGLKVENGGSIRGGSMPLGGGQAVEAFVEGVRRTVQEGEEEGK